MSQNTNSIEDRLDAEYAAAWRPDPGDSLIGEVVELGERSGEYGDYPIVTVKPEDGEPLAFHAFHSVAASQLAEQRPKIGDRIAIRYRGKVKGDGPHGPYHAYRVLVDRPAGTSIEWGKYGDEPPADSADDESRAQTQLDAQAERDARDADVPF